MIHKNMNTYHSIESYLLQLKSYLSKASLGGADTHHKDVLRIEKLGYLPDSHQKVLDEWTDEQVLSALLLKMKIYMRKQGIKESDNIDPVKHGGYQDSSWLGKTLHHIKLINLSGLGNGHKSKQPGRLMDWYRQLLILPAGRPDQGILGDTVYLLPFHTREFGCNYIPKKLDVSDSLVDPGIQEHLGLCGFEQMELFIQTARACGHPVIYDVLPQTGRFNLDVLKNPFIVRWFDISALDALMNVETSLDDAERYASLIRSSREMGGKQAQETILGKVKETIADFLEEKGQDIELYQNELIHHLMQSGYWPAPGGAWNSYHMPIYTGKDCKGIPQFDHLDRDGNNVNEWAILDCQSPYYFYHFDTKTYNQPVIDHWIKLLLKLQKDFHFDGYRLDHVDHIVDYYSVSDDLPISYRAPASVLKRMNQELKAAVPTFATLAEYMLWDSFQGAYHQEMGFDVLWGDDMIAQWRKDIAAIDKDNHELASYNRKLQQNPLSILKTYNNQDGAIDAFDQYPGQLSEQGALFKWLKLHFLNAGPMSGRSIIYVDGDESFTQKTVQYGINHEEALCRNRDDGFTKSFNAITRLSLKHAELVNQPSKILTCGNTDGFAAWYTYQESSSEGLLIVANEKPPTECVIVDRQNHIHLTYSSCYDKRLLLDQGFEILGEYLLEESGYVLQTNAFRHAEELWFEELKPSEFHIYGIRRKR